MGDGFCGGGPQTGTDLKTAAITAKQWTQLWWFLCPVWVRTENYLRVTLLAAHNVFTNVK